MTRDFSRRQFLKYSGAAAVGTLSTTLTFADAARAASTQPLAAGTPILVIVTLYGGNDGLNTVVPYTDPAYVAARPGMSLTPAQVLPLSSSLGLNGVMTGFKSLWDANQMAIVLGVSYPQPNLSHFSSMAIWQSASPVEQVSSGWIGRWLDGLPDDPFRAIGIDSVLTPLLAGDRRSGSMLPVSGIELPWGSLSTQIQLLSHPSSSDPPLVAAAASSIADLYEVAATVAPAMKTAPSSSLSSLGQQLTVVSELITANVPTQVYSVTYDGFDTHADELNSQNALLGTVSSDISTFMTGLASSPRANDVVVMVYSEFGRRVQANESQGTDHGSSAPVFLIGSRVVPGFAGEQPSLTQLVDGDLAVTVDFRDVYASLLEDVLATPADKVLPGWKTKLPLISAT